MERVPLTLSHLFMETLEFHPIANLFPLMEGKDLEELVGDMKVNGFNSLFPIILYEGKILDGRNRYRAAALAKVEPECVSPHISNPFAVVTSANLHRRHLTMEQRAFVSADMANMKQGYNPPVEKEGSPVTIPPISLEKAAKLMEVSESSAKYARRVKRDGIPELETAVRNGKIGLRPAGEITQLPKEKQREALSKATSKSKPATPKKPVGKATVSAREEEIRKRAAQSMIMKDGKLGVTREEFDPEFKGTSQEFIDKYGHVQIWTKKEYEDSNDQAAFSTWVGAIRDLRVPLKKYLEGKPFKPENFEAWVGRGNQPEKRRAEMQELALMIVRTKQSIEWLLSFFEKEITP